MRIQSPWIRNASFPRNAGNPESSRRRRTWNAWCPSLPCPPRRIPRNKTLSEIQMKNPGLMKSGFFYIDIEFSERELYELREHAVREGVCLEPFKNVELIENKFRSEERR